MPFGRNYFEIRQLLAPVILDAIVTADADSFRFSEHHEQERNSTSLRAGFSQLTRTPEHDALFEKY